MSFYDKASLILIPSGTKEGVCFSQKPTNGDGDFTFTRASSATRVNSDGLIEKETQNLITYSNDLSNAVWVKTAGSVSGSKFTPNTVTTFHNLRRVISIQNNSVYAYSIELKADGYDFVLLNIPTGAGTNAGPIIDLTDGSVAGNYGGTTHNAIVESAADGYYRVKIWFLSTSTSLQLDTNVFPTSTVAAYAGDGTSGVLIRKAQLNQGLVADSYLETTTTAVYGGITDNIPRLDYTDASCPSLLLEPQRTNLLTDSEFFGSWDLNASGISSIQPNYSVSPEGLQNAYKVNFIVQGDSDIGLKKSFSVTGGSTYTHSIYIKGEGSDIGKDIVVKSKRSGGDSAGTTTIQTLTADWVRIDFQTTYAANNTAANFYLSSNDASSVLVYGAQVEQSSYVTSIIPTYGASVTRVADVCNNAGNASTFNDSEGVLYAEIYAFDDDAAYRQISIDDGTNNSRHAIWFYNNSIGSATIASGSYSYLPLLTTTFTPNNFYKIAYKYKQNDFALWVNGIEVGQSSTGNVPSGLSQLDFDNGVNQLNFYGKARSVKYFPTALTNEELADLTTI